MPSPRRTLSLLVAALALAAGWGLMAGGGADAVSRLDRSVLLALSDDGRDPIGPAGLEEAVRDVTALGSVTVLASMTVATAPYLALAGRRRAALHALTVFAGSGLLSELLKATFSRARPEVLPHAMRALGWSFPSGHTLMSTATFLTLAVLLASGEERRALRRYLVALGALLALAVGVSRVYLAVHWPTDVLAGWLVGGAWAGLAWRAGRRLGLE